MVILELIWKGSIELQNKDRTNKVTLEVPKEQLDVLDTFKRSIRNGKRIGLIVIDDLQPDIPTVTTSQYAPIIDLIRNLEDRAYMQGKEYVQEHTLPFSEQPGDSVEEEKPDEEVALA